MGLAAFPAVFAAAVATADDEHFSAIIGEADLLASLARSVAEAAFRRDHALVTLHVIELRQTGRELVQAYCKLSRGRK